MKTPVILITGKNGQVGWELQRTIMPLGHVVAVDVETMDLSNPDSIVRTIRELKPDIIINAAAYTAVDKAEEETALAMKINGIAPGLLAEEAKRLGALLVHYSTDYVFDGTKQTAYTESDRPNPINYYGKTKLAGEQAVQATGGDILILRTSWVYSARGNNFLLTMLRLMKERETLRIIDDQEGAPTWSRLIAETTAHIVGQSFSERKRDSFKPDVYHLTGAGSTSWYGFAVKIRKVALEMVEQGSLIVQNIEAIQTEAYPTPARRPMNSCMSLNKLEQHYDMNMPSWGASLTLCMRDIEVVGRSLAYPQRPPT